MINIKFYLLRDRKKDVTGGHKYERSLTHVIEDLKGINFKETVVGAPANTSKLITPFIEFIKGIKKSKNTDIIIFNSSACLRLLPVILFLRWFSKIKLYTVHHHFIYLEFSGLKRFIYKTAERWFLNYSHKIIVPSPYIYGELKKTRNVNDLLLWRIPFNSKQEFEPNPKIGNLTLVCTIEPRKGIIYLLEALKILQDNKVNYHLDIIGKVVNNSYYESLKSYIKANNLNVKFDGFLEIEEKNKILSETDVFVFPSLLEGFGMVLVEAQVYGLPIVAFDNSSMPFTIKNNINGFTVPTTDVHSFAKRIQEIVTNRLLRNKLSQGAYLNLKSQWDIHKFQTTVRDYFSALIK